MSFAMGPSSVRRTLYQNFAVREAESTFLRRPVYLATCRTCMRIVAVVDRVDQPIDAAPVLAALEHCKRHADELVEPLFP